MEIHHSNSNRNPILTHYMYIIIQNSLSLLLNIVQQSPTERNRLESSKNDASDVNESETVKLKFFLEGSSHILN